MMLSEIRDWMKTQIDSPNWYISKIDGKKEQSIGIYNLNTGQPYIAIGGWITPAMPASPYPSWFIGVKTQIQRSVRPMRSMLRYLVVLMAR